MLTSGYNSICATRGLDTQYNITRKHLIWEGVQETNLWWNHRKLCAESWLISTTSWRPNRNWWKGNDMSNGSFSYTNLMSGAKMGTIVIWGHRSVPVSVAIYVDGSGDFPWEKGPKPVSVSRVCEQAKRDRISVITTQMFNTTRNDNDTLTTGNQLKWRTEAESSFSSSCVSEQWYIFTGWSSRCCWCSCFCTSLRQSHWTQWKLKIQGWFQ